MFALFDFVLKHCKNAKQKNWSKWLKLPRWSELTRLTVLHYLAGKNLKECPENARILVSLLLKNHSLVLK
jgi:hypothetical protein